MLFQGNLINLRPFEPEDIPALQAYLNHPDLVGRRYLPSGYSEIVPLSRKGVQTIYEKIVGFEEEVCLAVTLLESGKLVGHAGCYWGWDTHCPEIYLVIAPDHQRHGYGTEVIEQLLRYLFEHTPAHVVTSWAAVWNASGVHFLMKHGFHQAGRSRRAGIYQGSYFDLVVADMLRQEWAQRSKGSSHGA